MICAEGYVFTFTRRGYIGTGLWTPQFVLDYPEVLREAHYDFVRAGSDVVQALQVGRKILVRALAPFMCLFGFPI